MMKHRRGRAVDCLWVAQHTHAYLDGELNKQARAALEEHLAGCPDCAAQVQDVRDLLALVAACDDVQPDAALHESVMRSVREQPRVGRTAAPRNWRRIGAGLAAACLLLGVLLISPAVLRGANADSPQNNTSGGNESNNAQSPSVENSNDGALNGGGSHWWDEVFGGLIGGSDKEDESAPGGDDTPNESPEASGDSANGESNGGFTDSNDSITVTAIKLTRVDGDATGETLWERLQGEWEREGLLLIVDTDNEEAFLLTDEQEYRAYATMAEDMLILEMEDGENLIFEVTMEGDTLWLTPKY